MFVPPELSRKSSGPETIAASSSSENRPSERHRLCSGTAPEHDKGRGRHQRERDAPRSSQGSPFPLLSPTGPVPVDDRTDYRTFST